MRWLTRARIRMDRVACAWLITRYIDSEPEFVFSSGHDPLEQARAAGAVPFVVPRAELGRRDERIRFDVMLDKNGLCDPALRRMADIIRAADISALRGSQPESEGVRAVSHGFFLTEFADMRAFELQLPVLDALLRYCQEQVGRNP